MDKTEIKSERSSAARLSRRVGVASVAVGAGLGAAGDADAGAVTLQQVSLNVPLTLRNGGLEFLDLDADGVLDYAIDGHNYMGGISFDFMSYQAYQNYESGGRYEGPGDAHNYHHPGALAPGSAVGPIDASWSFGPTALFETATPSGDFLNNRGWLGLYFEIPNASPHYGYLDIQGTFDPNNPDDAFLTIHGGAYALETDTPIDAVPEPGSLALLASGAAGLALWRSRRRRSH